MTSNNLFKEEIRFLVEESDRTLAEIIIHEQYMNQRRENVNEYNLTKMSELIETVLRIWSVIDAYKYFEAVNKPITDYGNKNENQKLFVFVVEEQYVARFNLFVNELGLN